MNTDVAQKLEELTYERQDLCDFDPIWETLEQNCPLAQPSSIAGSNTASLQALRQSDLLPLEILQNILQLFDLHTVTLMLSISHRSKLLVDSLPHAPNALREILGTGLAPHFTIDHLSRALRAQDCSECGSFGAYLHLLNCRRYCWLCVTEVIDIRPITKEAAKTLFRLTDNILRELPCIQRAIQGQYGLDRYNGYTHTRQIARVGIKAAREAGVKSLRSQGAMEENLCTCKARRTCDGQTTNSLLEKTEAGAEPKPLVYGFHPLSYIEPIEQHP